jgi:hypothetical protein
MAVRVIQTSRDPDGEETVVHEFPTREEAEAKIAEAEAHPLAQWYFAMGGTMEFVIEEVEAA